MMILATFVVVATLSAISPSVPMGQAVVNDLNDHRGGASVPLLTVDPVLTQVAADRATDLIERHYFSHVSPDGTTVVDTLRQRRCAFAYAGENLASAASLPIAEAALWNSLEHRENIMNAHYRRVGIAVVWTADGGELVVEVFTD
jgi:uncharacterized protein YkwD